MRQFRIPTTLDRSGELNRTGNSTDPRYRNEKPIYSYSEKTKNDFAAIEAKAEYWYNFLKAHDSKDKDNYLINFDLANGLGDKYMSHMRTPITQVLKEEGVKAPFEEVMFVDYLSPIIKSMSGAQRRKPLKYHVTDEGPFGYTQYQQQKANMLRTAFQEQVIEPAKQQLLMNIQQQQPELFSEEAASNQKIQQQLNQKIEEGLKEEFHERIFESLDKNYKNEAALSSTVLLKNFEKHLKFKFKFDEGYKLIFPSGREVYLVENDYTLDIKLCDPVNFYVYKPKNTIFFQDATACMYEEEVDIYKMIAEFSNVLGSNKIKDFENDIFETLNGLSMTDPTATSVGSFTYDDIDPNTKDNPNMKFGRMDLHRHDLRTPQGQQAYQNDLASNRYTRYHNVKFNKIRLQYRENRVAKLVRRNPDPLTTEWDLVDDVYTKQEGIDYEVRKEIIEEIWDIDMFGYMGKFFFLRKRLLPNQYSSSTDYKHPKFSFKGADFNTFFGNTKNVAPIEHAKPWIFKACLHSHFIDEKVATDIGNVMVGSSHFKPKKYTDAEWKTKMKLDKFLDIDATKEGSQGMDLQYLFRSVPMGSTADSASRINYQQYLEGKILASIGFNAERLAQISPYMPAANVQNSINMANLQIADIEVYHNMIIEQVLNDFLDAAIVYLKHNPFQKMVMLPDLSQVALNMDWENIKKAQLKVNVEIDPALDEKTQQLQQYLMGLANAGFLEFDEIIEITFNPEYQYLKEYARIARKRKEMKEQQEREFQQQMQQAQSEAADKAADKQFQQNMALQAEITKRDLAKEEIRSTLMQKGYDVDQDNQNDLLEVKQLEMDTKERMHKIDTQITDWYNKAMIKLGQDKLKVDNKKVTKSK